MSFSRFFLARLALGGLFALSAFFSSAKCAAAEEIIYDNTTTFLEHFSSERTEFGHELHLAGTARTLTELAFEYFGEFSQQGDEFVKVRVYSNETPYDLYRNSPTKLLYESGLFGINPGYSTRILSGFGTVLPDVVTVTFQFYGLAQNEKAGVLLYDPPSVGKSFNEFWRLSTEGIWQPIIYSTTDPKLKAKAAIRLKAVETLRLKSLVSTNNSIQFQVVGVPGSACMIEGSTNFNTWTLIATPPVTQGTATFNESIQPGNRAQFYRARVP